MNIVLSLLIATSIALISGQAYTSPTDNSPMVADSSKTLIATSPEPPSSKTSIRIHRVSEGENLGIIAENYNLDVDTLLSANPNAVGIIHPGDELIILPQKGILHVVESGDNVWSIARTYGVNVEVILTANNKQEEFLAVGEKLIIPGGRMIQPVSRAIAVRFIWPVSGEISSYYGYRWGRMHSGIDIAENSGTPVVAARSGRVIFSGWMGGYGYTTIIEHGQGYTTLYAHLSDYAVDAGQYVTTGQLIGYVGSTGYSSGPHLHFEIRQNDQTINPLNLLP